MWGFLTLSRSKPSRLWSVLVWALAAPELLAAEKPRQSPPVVINEIQYHAEKPRRGLDLEDREWIELFNPGRSAAAIAGWTLSGAIRFEFPPHAELAAAGYCVVARRLGAFEKAHNDYSGSLFGPYEGKLDNAGERLELRDGGGALVDAVEYTDSAPWPALADGEGPTLELLNPAFDNEAAGSWKASRFAHGTPGRRNSTYQQDVDGRPPPWVCSAFVRQAPARHGYSPHRSLTVDAAVAGGTGDLGVRLLLQVVSPGAYIQRDSDTFEGNWTSVEMSRGDDGAYAASFGPFSRRTLVRWKVRVEDALGRGGFYPRRRDPVPNRAVFFYDQVPAFAAAGPAGNRQEPTRHSNDQGPLERVPVYFLLAHPRDIDAALHARVNRYDRVYRWRGTFVCGGRVYDHVQFRLRGAERRYRFPKPNLKIRFERGLLFRPPRLEGFSRHARRRLNLNAAVEYFALNEVLAYRVFEAAGVTPQIEPGSQAA